jgi:hypothetical protein
MPDDAVAYESIQTDGTQRLAVSFRFSLETSGMIGEQAGWRPTVRHGVPPLPSRDDAYYWTAAWQSGERRSLNDYKTGRYESFENGREAVRWLFEA